MKTLAIALLLAAFTFGLANGEYGCLPKAQTRTEIQTEKHSDES